MQRSTPIVFFCLSSLLTFAAASAVSAAGVSDGYKAPEIALAVCLDQADLDGEVHEDEWRGAESVNVLQTPDHALSTRPTRFWMMWDADNIYVAMRSPLRPGERFDAGAARSKQGCERRWRRFL